MPLSQECANSRRTEDEWLWGWDPTPGIVSVWAEADGRGGVAPDDVDGRTGARGGAVSAVAGNALVGLLVPRKMLTSLFRQRDVGVPRGPGVRPTKPHRWFFDPVSRRVK
jgi:hypothetical protein